VVATPDHWHALMTMMACAAGKDVYVEKPLHLFVREGEWMQTVVAKHKRVVQVGTQQRSAPHYQRARELIRNGAIGDICSVQCDFFRNVMPGIGNPPDGQAPPEFDWEMHLGPAPARPYNPNRAIYHFRWFWDTAGGQMTNLGHHSLDIVHWMFDLKAPRAVSGHGGRWFLNDNGETPIEDANLMTWFLDPDIEFPNPGEATNAEPLLINTAGSLQYRPESQVELQNLFLASDYVRTYTDIACMEAANEAARRAVNCLLLASGSNAPPAGLWPLSEPAFLRPLQEIDRIRFSLHLPHHMVNL